jgi:hypothetical protein
MTLNENNLFPLLPPINAAIYIFGLGLMTADNPISILVGAFILALVTLIEAKAIVFFWQRNKKQTKHEAE